MVLLIYDNILNLDIEINALRSLRTFNRYKIVKLAVDAATSKS